MASEEKASPGTSAGKVRFEEIEVERINIVDRNGTLRLAISNTERCPDPVINGKTYARQGDRVPGLIFFNDEGTECGGLVYGGRKRGSGHFAGASLTFDQFEQDQVVQLYYDDEEGERAYGLDIRERPTKPLGELMIRWEPIMGMPEGADRDRAVQDFYAEFPVAQRLFVGRSGAGEAILKLNDSKGRPRIVARVDKDDIPRLEFLDEDGRVTYSLPPERPQSR